MEAVQELIKDLNVNAADELDGTTALHEAALNGTSGNIETILFSLSAKILTFFSFERI